MLDRITLDPAVCHGKPTIRGLRYPVEMILELLASGASTQEILEDYPDLEAADVQAALEHGSGEPEPNARGARCTPLGGPLAPPQIPAPMPTETLEIPYPAGFEEAVHLTKSEMAQHIRLMAALKMFELGKISGGKAAELAGMTRTEFYEACGRYRVSVFNYADEDAEAELRRDLETLRGTGQP